MRRWTGNEWLGFGLLIAVIVHGWFDPRRHYSAESYI